MGAEMSEVSASGWWEELAGLLERRRALCEGLLELGREQKLLMETEGSIEALMSVLGKKQDLLRALDGVGAALTPLRTAWDERRDEVPTAQRERIRRLSEGAGEALKEALVLEAAGCEIPRASRGESPAGLAHAEMGRRVAARYAGQRTLDVSRIDEQG